MMVHFRKRFPVEDVARINEYVCTGKWPEDGRNVDRNDGVPEEIAVPEAENEEADDDDRDDTNKPSGGKKSLKGRKNPNTSKKKEKRRKKNHGKLIMDATVAPADVKFPTDIDLLNQCREHLETAINLHWPEVPHTGHKLPYSAKKSRKAYLKIAKIQALDKETAAKGHSAAVGIR